MAKSPLYFTGIAPDGKLLLGGIFRMKDEVGFPMDMSYELAKDKGYHVDWCECLADAGRQKQSKFESTMREIGYLIGDEVAKEIGEKFALLVKFLVGSGDFTMACEAIIQMKHG
jgi:hypothetical protein